ncbi:DUF2523 family protein [Nitrincola sp.]|uniref:DUF2523 family protein n=1 Tax=Nitrincola sp. TaxID=1926584 RepID=UPI003A8D40E8
MIEFFNAVYEWLNSGIYGFFTELSAYFIKQSVLGYFQFLYVMIPFAWGIAQSILNDLNLSSHLNSAFSSLGSDVLGYLTFFNIPEALNTVISAYVTKFVLKFIPGV